MSSLSNLVDNIAQEIHKVKCKYGHDNKKCEKFGVKYKDSECYLEYTKAKDDLLIYKCSCCNRSYQKKFDEDLRKQSANIYRFWKHDVNKFILLLVFIHMNTWIFGKKSVNHHYLKKNI